MFDKIYFQMLFVFGLIFGMISALGWAFDRALTIAGY